MDGALGLPPLLVALRRQDGHHALFVRGLVELIHKRVRVGIDGQHTKKATGARVQ